MNELKYKKSEGGRIPVPEFVLDVMTKEEFNDLPDYTRYRIRQKGTTTDLRLIEGPRTEAPEPYTEEEWASFSVYKRYHLSHPAATAKKTLVRRDRKFYDLVEWDRHQFSSKLSRVFNITIEQYELLFNNQNGLCALCKQPEKITYQKEIQDGVFVETPRRLAVDHDHSCCDGNRSCGKCIRGLLCFDCNKRLHSKNGEALEWMKNAVSYLENQKEVK